MQTKLQKLLNESRFTPHTDLENTLFVNVQKKIRIIMRIKLASYFTIGILSSISLVFYLNALYVDLSNSGAYNYLHLIVGEDVNTLLLISKEMLYAILESIPMMSITLSLGLLFMVMISINGVLVSLQRKFIYNKY